MVEITKIEQKSKDSDNALITFKTDLGDIYTIERPLRYIQDERLLKELIWNTAQYNDFKKSFTTKTQKITITEADVYPERFETIKEG